MAGLLLIGSGSFFVGLFVGLFGFCFALVLRLWGLFFPPSKVNNLCGVLSWVRWQGELAVHTAFYISCVIRQNHERTSRGVSA